MSAIYTLSIECVSGAHLTKEYGFVIELRSDSTLDELAGFILDTARFDGDHLSEFFIAKDLRAKNRIPLAERGPWDNQDDSMDTVRVCDVFPLAKKQALYYGYDAGSNWRFEIVMKGPNTPPAPRRKYPRIVDKHGRRPPEYGTY